MEEHTKLFNLVLSMHHHKAKIKKEPTAYLLKREDCMNPNSPLVAYKEKHLLSNFNHDSKQFQWLMKQFKTYDTEKQVLVGLILDNDTFLSEVLVKR
jgi:hypothetical protein